MSQAKVDRNKELKKNRKKIIKKQKRGLILEKIVLSLILVAVVAWIGYSAYGVYEQAHADDPLEAISIDLSAIEDYVTALSDSASDDAE